MNILHIDDHPLFTEGIRSYLELRDSNMSLKSCDNAEAALSLLDKAADIDLILLDLMLPSMHGTQFINAINERGLLIPIVVMSAVEDLWQIKTVLDAGAMGFIPKTASSESVFDALTQIQLGQCYIPEDLVNKLEHLPPQIPRDHIDKLLTSLGLTRRQYDVLKLLKDGHSNKQIANILFVSNNTVKTHTRMLFQQLEVNNRFECVKKAETLGLFAHIESTS